MIFELYFCSISIWNQNYNGKLMTEFKGNFLQIIYFILMYLHSPSYQKLFFIIILGNENFFISYEASSQLTAMEMSTI